jgi:hypothetical protein
VSITSFVGFVDMYFGVLYAAFPKKRGGGNTKSGARSQKENPAKGEVERKDFWR